MLYNPTLPHFVKVTDAHLGTITFVNVAHIEMIVVYPTTFQHDKLEAKSVIQTIGRPDGEDYLRVAESAQTILAKISANISE